MLYNQANPLNLEPCAAAVDAMKRKKLRAELAAAALSGLIKHYSPALDPSRIAERAVQIADAVMDRLDD